VAHKETHGKGQEHGMTLTEDEAKSKRCQESFGDTHVSPGGQTFAATGAIGGAYAQTTSPSYCIGSACMAWRWSRPDGMTDKGYCGKAGQP